MLVFPDPQDPTARLGGCRIRSSVASVETVEILVFPDTNDPIARVRATGQVGYRHHKTLRVQSNGIRQLDLTESRYVGELSWACRLEPLPGYCLTDSHRTWLVRTQRSRAPQAGYHCVNDRNEKMFDSTGIHDGTVWLRPPSRRAVVPDLCRTCACALRQLCCC